MEGHKPVYKVRNQLIHPLKRDLIRVHRQSIEGGPIQAGETLQSIQSPLLIEHLRVALESMGRIEDAGTSAGTFLGCPFVRCRVGAEKEVWVTAGGRPAQGLTVTFALGYGEAIKITPQPASKHLIAVDVQMVGGDGGGEMAVC